MEAAATGAPPAGAAYVIDTKENRVGAAPPHDARASGTS